MCLFVSIILVDQWTTESQTTDRVRLDLSSSLPNEDFSLRPKVTNVTANHMNSVLGSVLKLINNNIDTIDAPWMKRIAGKKIFSIR